jgi:structural maintenance of chromosome 3 (chondroitin sulfate proteoglycan 6)
MKGVKTEYRSNISQRLADRTRRVNELYSKQGRSAQFKSKKERDAFLKSEVKQVDSQIAAKKEQA